jgi:hypothetical protein
VDSTTAKRVIIGSLLVTVVAAEAKRVQDGKGPTIAPPVGGLLAGAALTALAGPAPEAAASMALIVLVAGLAKNTAGLTGLAAAAPYPPGATAATAAATGTSAGLDALRAIARSGSSSTSSAYASPLPGGTAYGPPPQIVTVTGPAGQTMKVAASVAPQVRLLLAAAQRDGLVLRATSAYRTPEEQAALRRAHCTHPDTDPASACHPPTAPVGSSMHEKGLAIDFADCSTHSTAVFRWLAGHAAAFGFYNLPSEPWHWSTTGK